MGLDRGYSEWLNKNMFKSFMKRLGLGMKQMRKSPVAKDRERFEADVREQFQKLKDKGLSIPVFTL